MKTWSSAFLAQAAADLDAYTQLTQTSLPTSQRLHFLQMWLEKLCKAHIYNADREDLKTSHNVVVKILPQLIREHWRRIGYDHPPRGEEIGKLCREIDLLHPQVNDANRRPDNVEYPWLGTSGEIDIPAEWKFPLAARLESNTGRLLLKASSHLTRNPALFLS